MQRSSYRLHRYDQWNYTWLILRSIWQAYRCHDDLERLILWARRKRLSNPKRLYEKRLVEVEEKVFRYRLRYPRLVMLVSILQTFFTQIKFQPYYYTKGSAAKYRYH